MLKRIVSRQEDLQPGDILVFNGDPAQARGENVFIPRQPGDLADMVFCLFGNNRSGLALADTPFLLEGLTPDQQTEVLDAVSAVAQQWGTSVIDAAHGIANVIGNACSLLNQPRLVGPLCSVPVIAVGAGPSTTALMDTLVWASKRTFIVAADAALKPLLAAGVRVHACTPLERLNSTAQKVVGTASDAVFCGSPFVPPDACAAFKHHLLWTPPDPLMEWYTGEEIGNDYTPGTTSGTSAAAVALRLTTSNVYLVGHDLCGGHMEGATVSAGLADAFDSQRMGNDGTLRPTKMAWLRAKSDLESMGGRERLFNAGAAIGHGLKLNGIEIEALPEVYLPAGVESLVAACQADELMGKDRLKQFRQKTALLCAHIENAAFLSKTATCLEHLALERLCPEENRDAMGYLVRSVYAQASLERRLGRPVATVIEAVKQAFVNIADTVVQPLREVIRDA